MQLLCNHSNISGHNNQMSFSIQKFGCPNGDRQILFFCCLQKNYALMCRAKDSINTRRKIMKIQNEQQIVRLSAHLGFLIASVLLIYEFSVSLSHQSIFTSNKHIHCVIFFSSYINIYMWAPKTIHQNEKSIQIEANM